MERQHLPFVDWLKAFGLGLIVYGHVAAATTAHVIQPLYPKQLGVAFFVFVTGFTLAREKRPGWWVVYSRSFEVFTFGLAFAVLMSGIGLLLWGDSAESNYLPLAGGLHVFFNDFPANPTTWYIGTYLHLLLLWALVLRRIRLTPWVLVAVCALEILVRAMVILAFGRYVAYMWLSNWISVLALGLILGRDQSNSFIARRSWLVSSAVLIVGWPILMEAVGWESTFPFMSLPFAPPLWGAVSVSMAASFVYVAYTLAAYRVAITLPETRIVKFFARNTVVVFIAHMPVYYGLEYLLRQTVPDYTARVTLEFLICLPGLAVASELLRRVFDPRALGQRLAVRVGHRLGENNSVSRV